VVAPFCRLTIELVGAAGDRRGVKGSVLLGDPGFREAHDTRHAYVAGGMGKGIASEEWVIRLARAGILGYFGAGGLPIPRVATAVRRIRAAIRPDDPFGINFLHNPILPAHEEELTDLLLAEQVHRVEASAFIRVTPALVRYRLTGLRVGADGTPIAPNRIMAKLSRPEVARQFFAPPDPAVVAALHRAGRISDMEARLAARIPLADDVCAEADSGGHTDRRVAFTLVPHFRRMRDEIAAGTGLAQRVRIGAAGGIGTPDAVAAAFMLGADFVLTGSVNQCTPEAGLSDAAKDMLAAADLADFDIAPAGDMFEIGAKVQVLKRGTLFAGRANRLYELYRTCAGLHEIPKADVEEIESRYLGRSIDAVWQETATFYAAHAPAALAEAEANPRKKMAMVFRWYFIHSSRLAIDGRADQRANFQIHTGPAMAAANRWLKGTPLENWRTRNVDRLADRLMEEAAALFTERLHMMVQPGFPNQRSLRPV
jgi:trans-AT polyketide synthase/acyltransferase/oxidoreductase domain-containing protein